MPGKNVRRESNEPKKTIRKRDVTRRETRIVLTMQTTGEEGVVTRGEIEDVKGGQSQKERARNASVRLIRRKDQMERSSQDDGKNDEALRAVTDIDGRGAAESERDPDIEVEAQEAGLGPGPGMGMGIVVAIIVIVIGIAMTGTIIVNVPGTEMKTDIDTDTDATDPDNRTKRLPLITSR